MSADPVVHLPRQEQAVAVERLHLRTQQAADIVGRRRERQWGGRLAALEQGAIARRALVPLLPGLLRGAAAETEHPGLRQALQVLRDDGRGVEEQTRILVDEAEHVIGSGVRSSGQLVVPCGDTRGTAQGHELAGVRALPRDVLLEISVQGLVIDERQHEQHDTSPAGTQPGLTASTK
jgi:hypothetical protein